MVQLTDAAVAGSNEGRPDDAEGRLRDTGVRLEVAAGRPAETADSARRQTLAGLLITALAGAAFAQGAFYPRGQAWLAGLLALAGCLALTIRPAALRARTRPADRARVSVSWLTVAAIAGTGWPMLAGGWHGQLESGLRLGLLALAVPITIGCARRLAGASARMLLDGLLGLGAVLALLGWYGVLRHHVPLAIAGQGLYRAASTLSYPNATGVLLAMLALLGIARSADRRPGRGALLTLLLIGLAATLSRGALLAFAAGLLVLVVGLPGLVEGLGPRRVLTALAWPLTGAAVGTLALLPSMPVAATGNPVLATGGLLLGLAVGSMSVSDGRRMRWAYGVLAVGALAVAVLRPFPAVTGARLNVDSPDRWAAWRAGWQVFLGHPLTGAGPGLHSLSWRSPDGVRVFGYAHNEYLQLLATLGLLGLVLLLAGLAAIGALLRRYRADPADVVAGQPSPMAAAAAAVSVALLASMTLDFTGHFPILVLTAAAVVGCAVPARPARP
jgi:hypothetical protein